MIFPSTNKALQRSIILSIVFCLSSVKISLFLLRGFRLSLRHSLSAQHEGLPTRKAEMGENRGNISAGRSTYLGAQGQKCDRRSAMYFKMVSFAE
jgi:hypothetical protein